MQTTVNNAAEYRELPLAMLTPSTTNPRRRFDEEFLKGMAESIRAHGVLTPLLVRPKKERFEIVFGEQRYRSAQMAEKDTVPVRIRDMSDAEVLEAQLVENLQRRDVHPMEEAQGFKALLDLDEPKYSIEQLAAKTGKTPVYVAARLKLTELAAPVVEAFYAEEIGVGHALLLATHASLERERSMVASVDQGIHRYPALGGRDHFEPKASLRTEQRHAVDTILASQDFAINLRGAAGTGKTATLQEIDRGLHAAGHEVLAVAPTRSAVEELHKVGFGNSMTVSQLLEDQTAQQTLRGNVLIVDEAGMVSGRQMEGLLDLARREDARILFSGDTRQIQSVESSDALRILERESRMTSVSLTGIQRQSNLEYRDAIEAFRKSPDQGFAKLQDMGAVREVPYVERAQAVAEVYRELTAGQNRKVLVVAPTHEEIGKVTHAIREDLKQRAVLGDGDTLHRHIPLQWTEAQKKDLSNYQPDQVLVFHRASHGIEKHEALTVTNVFGSSIHAMNERGEEKSVSLTQAKSFSVYERMEIEVAVGDKLLMMGNRKEPGFRATNGELTTVRSVERGIINLEDGRSVPANYREFTHGYAVTAHRSQGKTVDHVIVSADVMKQELFYVAASRGREGISIVTSDVERLGESLGVSMARPSAIELANDIAQQKVSPNQDISQGLKQEIKLPIKTPEIGFEMGLGL